MLAMWQSHGDSVSEDTHDNHAAPDNGVHSAQAADGGHMATEGHDGAHGDAQGDSHGDGHAEHHGSKIPELPNLLGLIHHEAYSRPAGDPLHDGIVGVDNWAKGLGLNDPNGDAFTALETIIFGFVVVIGLCAFFLGASRQLKARPEKGEQLKSRGLFAEIVFEFFEDFFGAIVGRDKVRRHLPLVGTLFIYILVCNTMGLIFLGKAPTANLSFNLAMALVVFLYVHGSAIMQSPLGWLKHFPGTLPTAKELGMGGASYGIIAFMATLFTIIHIMELFIQPISLSLRLYGNLLGKDVLLGVFAGLIPWVPLHTPFLFLGLLLGAIQALIFSLLSAVYITMWEPHDHHEHHEHHDAHDHAHSHA